MIPSVYPLVGLFVALVALVIAFLHEHDVYPVLEAWTKYRKLDAFGMIVVGVVFVRLFVFGSTKPPPQPTHLWRFEFQNGLHDIGSYCTNDKIHAEWDYLPAYEAYTLKAKYRDLTIVNEVGVCIDVWHDMEDVPVSLMFAEWNVPNATNMSVVCYADYIPPPNVITNGVYHLNGVSRSIEDDGSGDPKFVPFTIQIYADLSDGEEIPLTPTNRPPAPIMNATRQNEED